MKSAHLQLVLVGLIVLWVAAGIVGWRLGESEFVGGALVFPWFLLYALHRLRKRGSSARDE